MPDKIEYVTFQGGRFRVLERLADGKLRLHLGFKRGQINTRIVSESDVEETNLSSVTMDITTVGVYQGVH